MNEHVKGDRSVGASFRATMRRFPATVTVITARDGVRDHGMTVTAVTSVSMDPPSLVVCLNNRTLLHEMMLSQPGFAVNVLRQDQEPVSEAFSGKVDPAERFGGEVWQRADTGMLLLSDAHANVVCRRVGAVPFGTHTLFIGEVVLARVDDASRPLLYENAGYCTASSLN